MTPSRPNTVALATDLYELTMATSYLALGMSARATFSLFVRRLPESRSCLVFAGLGDAIARLSALELNDASIDAIVHTGLVAPELARRLREVRFTGDVWAMREGRVFFPDEPILEVDAPILEAQLVETILLNAIHYPTLVASKAARCVVAARGRNVVDFGLRRTPGIDGGMTVARTSFMTGFAATSNVLAASRWGIPASGTVAHSFIESFDSERVAFEACAQTASAPYTLLVDTYDTLRGVEHAIEVAAKDSERRYPLRAVRLDSGDLAVLSRSARAMLDRAGLRQVGIVASGGLDEYTIDALVSSGAPIDGFAVGTRLGMSVDAPTLDMIYKLVAYNGEPRLKLSTGKETLVLPKQVYRRRDGTGRFAEDLITLREEPSPGPGWEPLLEPVVRAGLPARQPSIHEARATCASDLFRFGPELFLPKERREYRVGRSSDLTRVQTRTVQRCREANGLPRS